MEIKNLHQIIKENLNVSIKNFINEESNLSNDFLDDILIKLNVYFDKEKQKLMRKINLGEQMSEKIRQINEEIMKLGYEYDNIETDGYDGKYDIEYYIKNSETWGEDEYMENESRIYSVFGENNFDINVELAEGNNGKSCIRLSFNLNIINEFDI